MSIKSRIDALERRTGAHDGLCTCPGGHALTILYDGDPDPEPCPKCGAERMGVRFVLRKEPDNEHQG